MYKLVIIRHGLTEWSNRFTGWTDIDLAPSGIEQTKKYALRLKNEGYIFDLGFTSYLKRGIKTLYSALEMLNLLWIPIIKDWHLNERHYGALQEKIKSQVMKEYGEKQVHLWRRSWNNPPPKLELNDSRHPKNSLRYNNIPLDKIPNGESLKDTYHRVIPFWKERVEPKIKAGKRIIVSGHHNSLRAIVKYLDKISNEDIVALNIPYCIPLIYKLNSNLEVKEKHYLASNKEVEKAVNSIKNQIKEG